MSAGEYYAQRITPCECGSLEPYWHGPKIGLRVYCCDACWERGGCTIDGWEKDRERRTSNEKDPA
jgi:hypothetical protein